MMVKKYYLILILLLCWLSGSLSSCSLFNPPAIVPCYGHIDSIPLVITNYTQGTSANGINTAWVYLDDNPVGVFQLPCTFPMIAATGPHLITIFGGIEDAGEADNRLKYPFYSAYVLNNCQLTQGATVNFKPKVNYASWAHVNIIEDFEGSQVITNITNGSTYNYGQCDTSMFVVNSPKSNVYQGNGSGEVFLNSAHPNYFGVTDTFNIPNNGNAVFLEMNYKCSNTFTVGMINLYNSPATEPQVVYVDTSSTWKKMYINLQPTVAEYPSNAGYRIYFNVSLDNGNTVGQVFFDNIKLVRYN